MRFSACILGEEFRTKLSVEDFKQSVGGNNAT
jgi:hypothetical protein